MGFIEREYINSMYLRVGDYFYFNVSGLGENFEYKVVSFEYGTKEINLKTVKFQEDGLMIYNGNHVSIRAIYPNGKTMLCWGTKYLVKVFK